MTSTEIEAAARRLQGFAAALTESSGGKPVVLSRQLIDDLVEHTITPCAKIALEVAIAERSDVMITQEGPVELIIRPTGEA